jgi:hypothetical protein
VGRCIYLVSQGGGILARGGRRDGDESQQRAAMATPKTKIPILSAPEDIDMGWGHSSGRGGSSL